VNNTGYSGEVSGSTSVGGSSSSGKTNKYWSLGKCKKAYTTYLSSKNAEIEEQKNARRYYHGAQWTQDQIETLKKRRQPPTTVNEINRKVDGVVGILERMRSDPKAFPRTPKHEEGAELATASLRYVLDAQDWRAKDPEAARDSAIDGFGGIELELEQTNTGDMDVTLDILEPDSFFYDPRSYRMDFSDAQYMGVGKWMDIEIAKSMFPGKEDMLASSKTDEYTSSPDRDKSWFQTDGVTDHVRIVDCWYKKGEAWCWSTYCGGGILMEGESPFIDEKGKPYCKYIVFSANIDHDGDRYGFIRNLKSLQDEVNFRHSKGLHELSTRRIIGEVGAFDDIEKARREAARPDGIVLRNPGMEAQFDDTHKLANIEGAFKFLEYAQNKIQSFGFNPSLIGSGVQDMSGKAIQLQQQAGMAELGPFIVAYRGWKIRVYRAVWNAIQRYWTAERWIRITDNEGIAQFIQVNGMQRDPMTGQPSMVNAIGQLDVDIILDEGPDTVTIAQETHETLAKILQSVGPMLTPPEARAAVRIFLNTSSIPSTEKKLFTDASEQASQPDPMQQQARAAELQKLMGEGQEKQASAQLKQAQAQKAMMEAQMHPQAVQNEALAGMMGGQGQPQEYEVPAELQNEQAIADIQKTYSEVEKNQAAAYKAQQEGLIAPDKMIMEHENAAADRAINARNADEDRKIAAKQASQKNRPAQR
jgi:hypothetical protein